MKIDKKQGNTGWIQLINSENRHLAVKNKIFHVLSLGNPPTELGMLLHDQYGMTNV